MTDTTPINVFKDLWDTFMSEEEAAKRADVIREQNRNLLSHEESKALVDTLKNEDKIIEMKNFSHNFFATITDDPHYKKSLESYTKRQKKLVDYTLLEIGENVLKHGLKNIDTLDVPSMDSASKISIKKADNKEYDEVIIETENLFENKEVNETWGGIDKFLERINTINQKDLDTLDKEYQEEIVSGDINAHGGGNLGFVDIARKVKKMAKDFIDISKKTLNVFTALVTPVNEHISKLILKVTIPVPKTVLE